MPVVSNSSPLIAFAGIDQLNLLPAIFGSILVPPAVAVETRAERILLDDLPARRIARTLNLSVTGTVGVLLVAKRHALIPRVRPYLDALAKESFFIGPGLYDEVLHLAGEFDD